MKRYALPVYLYISVWFYNCTLVYRTWDGAIFSIHSFSRFFQTPKQGWANMNSIPFLYLYY